MIILKFQVVVLRMNTPKHTILTTNDELVRRLALNNTFVQSRDKMIEIYIYKARKGKQNITKRLHIPMRW